MKITCIRKSNFIPARLRTGLASLLLIGAAANSFAEGTSTLTASDALNTTSFNAAGHWSGGLAPGPGTNFFTAAFTMRTPSGSGNYSFAGDSLTIGSGGGLSVKGGSGNTITLNNLTNSGVINNSINPSTIAVLAGNMTVVGAATFNTGSGTQTGDARVITNNLTMSGTGTVTNTTLASVIGAAPGVVVYTANNTAFTGPLIVNSNQTVQAGSQSNFGGNPASFNAAQFVLNSGTFQPTASFAMTNANSGVTLGNSGGTFNVGTGITLTVTNPITGPGSLTKAGFGTVILSGANTYTNGTVVNAGILNVQTSSGLGTNGSVNQASGGRNSTLQLQGGITIPAAVGFILSNDGSGTNVLTTNALENISGNNTINASITLTVGGGNAAIQSDSGALVINGGVRIATGQSSRGVNLQGASTAANAINGPITDLSSTSVNSVTKNGTGNWTLSGTNTYSGLTLINGGTLAVTGSGSISSTPLISIAAGTTLDVSGMSSTFTLGAGQSISNSVGTVNGAIATAAGASIYPATVGVAGTLTCTSNLDMSAGGTVYFDLSTTAGSGNDQIAVGGNLTLSSSDYVHINALSGSLDTNDYVLFSVSTSTTMSTTPVLVWDGSVPVNYLNYSLLKVGNNVVLHFSASTAPSVTASVNPTSVTRNQPVIVTANVTQGTANITNVTVDLTQMGGSSTAGLILDSADSTPPTYIYTNTFFVSAGTALGNKSLTVVATDNSPPTPLTGTYIITPLTITANAVTWDGGASDNKWTSNTNWTGDIGPGYIGDSVTFDTGNQLTTDMNTNYSVTNLTFNVGAGAFTIGSSTGSTLTSGGGITNNSASTETLNVPVVVGAAQTFNAVSGNLTLNTNISLGGNTLTVDGTANTAIGGVISGTAGIAKNGSGTLLLSGVNTYGNNGASDTSVNVGVLAIGNNLALGTSRLNIGNGGTVQSADTSAHTLTNNLNFGSGAGGNVIFGGTGNLKLTGAANNGTDKILTVNNPQTELSGAMSGASGRTVAGTGILILSAANTYSSFTTINSGATLQLGNGSTNGSLATSSTIDDEGTLIFNRSDALVQGSQFSGAPITGGGSIVQAGAGTTTLNAANTYSGSTTVDNGELFITPLYQAGGNVSVADGAKFGISASSVSNSATIGSLTLGTIGATTLDFSYGFAGNPTNAALVAGAVTVNGTSTIRVGGSFVVGAFPVLNYSSLSGAFASTVVGPRGMTATLSNDAVHQIIYVTVSSVGGGIVWTGTNSVSPNLWDLNTTTNWLTGGLPTDYIETVPPGDAVTFNDLGSGTVLLSNTASPASVTISNALVNYTFQGTGQINASAGLTKVGAGTVTMNLPGTYGGNTVVSNGTLNIGANQTFANLSGNGAVTVTTGSPTLTVNDSLNTTFSGNISGATMVLGGGGQLTMTGSNSLSVNLFVSSGTLMLNSGIINASSYCSIGHVGTDNGTLTLKGTANFTTTSDFNVGDVGASVGTFIIQDTASLTANAFFVGSANAASSTASGTVYQTGGTVTGLSTTTGNFSIGGRVSVTSVGGMGTYNMSGGVLNGASPIRVGAVGAGTLNQSGGTVVASAGVDIATIAGATGTYEFDGGTLRTLNVTSSSGANSTMNFNGGVLIPMGNSTTFVTNVAQVNVRNGGVIVDTTNFNVTITPVLQHSPIGGDNAIDGGLTKRGNGTLSLTGLGSSYTGPTVVTGGALSLSFGSVSSLNNLTVSNAALNLAVTGGTTSFAAGSLTLAGNSALNLNYDLLSGAPVTAINASGSLTASGTTTINVLGYGWTVGQFPLVAYTGTPLANLSNFSLGVLPVGVAASLSNNVANNSIDLVVTSVNVATWIPLTATDPVGTSGFNAAGTWLSGVAPTASDSYFTRVFALRSPADANAYSFAGAALSIDAGGRFLMKGTGGQVITVNNLILNGGLVDYANSGDNFVETLAGNITLQAGVTSYLGALGSSGASETLFVTAPIGGSGNLQFGGSTVNSGTDVGVVVMAATNNYTGTTTVATGTLLVNGANGNSAITVNTNATLGGSGSIGGTVNVQAGGKLAPGIAARGALTDTIGTLTAGSAASVSGTVVMKISRTSSPTSDEFVAPAVTVNSGAVLTVSNIGSTNFVAGDTFTLFSTPISGAFNSVTLPALPGTNVFWTNNLAVNGSIAVVAVVTVNTNSTNITTVVSGSTLTLSWPADHLGWHLQVQTNSLSTGLGTNWVTIPGSDAVISTNLTIIPANGSVFYRMVYP